MKAKKSPECRSGTHGLCEVEWKDENEAKYLCDCAEGACHGNRDALAALRELD